MQQVDPANLEFVHDVLACLQRRNILFYGCPAKEVTLMSNGALVCWFEGMRAGKPWSGKVGFNVDLSGADLDQIAAANSPECLSDVVAQLIDANGARRMQ